MRFNSINTWILIGYSGCILSLTWFSPKEITQLTFIGEYDKIIHFLEYSVLGYLFANTMDSSNLRWKIVTGAGIYILIMAGIDELLQSYIPGRMPDVWDGFADLLGGFSGAIFKLRNLS